MLDVFLRYAQIGTDAGSLLTKPGLASVSSLVQAVESVARQSVALLDALQRRDGAASVQQLRTDLLRHILRVENSQVGGVKYIVELAHVVGEEDAFFGCWWLFLKSGSETSLCVKL